VQPTVLLVDDQPLPREALGAMLRAYGYSVVEVENGAAALDALRDGLEPGLILLDLHMDRMNGFEFRETQLGDPALAAIPVALLSADPNLAQRAPALAIRDYLEKPVDAAAVLDLVERYCGRGERRAS